MTNREDRPKKGIYARYLKRPMDLLCSLLALIALSPLLIVLALFVKIRIGSPVLFKTERPGLHEKIFTLYKLRSMTDQRDESGRLLSDSVRLTKFGRFLRSTSLDELPEFFNIVKGDMSIVGPRPLAVRYLPYYTKEEARRHTEKPGLTGLAQVNGRNALSWKEKFAFDIIYIDRITFRNDMSIILKTLAQAFGRTGIGERGTGTLVDLDKSRREKNEIGE